MEIVKTTEKLTDNRDNPAQEETNKLGLTSSEKGASYKQQNEK